MLLAHFKVAAKSKFLPDSGARRTGTISSEAGSQLIVRTSASEFAPSVSAPGSAHFTKVAKVCAFRGTTGSACDAKMIMKYLSWAGRGSAEIRHTNRPNAHMAAASAMIVALRICDPPENEIRARCQRHPCHAVFINIRWRSEERRVGKECE